MRGLSLFRAELLLWWRGSAAQAAFGYFLLALALAPVLMGTDVTGQPEIIAGLFWFLSTLSVLLALEPLFGEEAGDGRLEVLVQFPVPLWQLALQKFAAFWIAACLPAVLAAWPLALFLGGDADMAGRLCLSLILGTPALVFIAGSLAAICASLPRNGALVIFLALPLFVPVLIFGSQAAIGGEKSLPALFYLAAYSLAMLALAPFLTAAALRQHLS